MQGLQALLTLKLRLQKGITGQSNTRSCIEKHCQLPPFCQHARLFWGVAQQPPCNATDIHNDTVISDKWASSPALEWRPCVRMAWKDRHATRNKIEHGLVFCPFAVPKGPANIIKHPCGLRHPAGWQATTSSTNCDSFLSVAACNAFS